MAARQPELYSRKRRRGDSELDHLNMLRWSMVSAAQKVGKDREWLRENFCRETRNPKCEEDGLYEPVGAFEDPWLELQQGCGVGRGLTQAGSPEQKCMDAHQPTHHTAEINAAQADDAAMR